tara:strand:+ start:1036 stop:3291 length:2256 start_codon:yes stop_codon:yes gene_type:complete
MKPIATNKNSLQSQGVQKSVNFGIKASGLHHILGILRNQLYSDKVLAVIREYSCNAHDAHIQAGCADRPIEVTLPTRLSPIFKCRDYGDALSQQEIQDVYAFYGESTKRNTNDQIGMLGIGSKAAFAYGDNYVINSFLDGKKHIYNAFIDPSQIGQISKIGEEDTDEENGIEIVVPVNDVDCAEFEEKAKDLFKWFAVTPIIKGCSQFEYEKSFIFKGDGWSWLKTDSNRYNRGDATLVMGNIGYPIDEYSLGSLDDDEDNRLGSMMCDNLVIYMDIGDVEISASREKLQYTDYTRKNIKNKLKAVADALVSTISKQFKDCKTLWDCKCLMGEVFDMGSNMYHLRNIVEKKMTFNGKKIGDASVSASFTNADGDYDHIDLRNWTKSWRSGRYQCKETNTIDAKKQTVVIENDLGHRRGITGRILPLIHNKEQKPFLITFKNAKEKKTWLKVTGFDGKMVKLTSLPQHKLNEFAGYETASGGTGRDTNKKHSAKCFEFDFDFEGRNYHSKKSDWWKIADLDVENESGVYVIIDGFNIAADKHGRNDNPAQLKRLKESFKEAGIEFPKTVYAFKVGQRHKIEGKEGWMHLYDHIKVKTSIEITDNNLEQAWIDTEMVKDIKQRKNRHTDIYGVDDLLKKMKDNVLAKLVSKDEGTFGDFLEKHEYMSHKDDTVKISTIRSICSDYSIEFKVKGVKPTYELDTLLKNVRDKYDMINYLAHDAYGWNWNPDFADSLGNYINVIDVCQKSSNTIEE